MQTAERLVRQLVHANQFNLGEIRRPATSKGREHGLIRMANANRLSPLFGLGHELAELAAD